MANQLIRNVKLCEGYHYHQNDNIDYALVKDMNNGNIFAAPFASLRIYDNADDTFLMYLEEDEHLDIATTIACNSVFLGSRYQ
jgi:hypothetical protein